MLLTFEPESLIIFESIQKGLDPGLLTKIVKGFTASFPVTEIIENHNPPIDNPFIKYLECKRNGIIPICIDMQKLDFCRQWIHKGILEKSLPDKKSLLRYTDFRHYFSHILF